MASDVDLVMFKIFEFFDSYERQTLQTFRTKTNFLEQVEYTVSSATFESWYENYEMEILP